MRRLILVAGLCATSNLAEAQDLWSSLMHGQKAEAWQDPLDRFSLELPPCWTPPSPKAAEGPLLVFACQVPAQGLDAILTIEVRNLPPTVKLSHLMATVEDETKKEAPAYRRIAHARRSVAGLPAIAHRFVYQEQNNAALANHAFQLVLMQGERGYILTLLSRLGTEGSFAPAWEQILKRFSPGGQFGDPLLGPEGRRRLRPKEMVSPEKLRY